MSQCTYWGRGRESREPYLVHIHYMVMAVLSKRQQHIKVGRVNSKKWSFGQKVGKQVV
jgi:hypothetical protein